MPKPGQGDRRRHRGKRCTHAEPGQELHSEVEQSGEGQGRLTVLQRRKG